MQNIKRVNKDAYQLIYILKALPRNQTPPEVTSYKELKSISLTKEKKHLLNIPTASREIPSLKDTEQKSMFVAIEENEAASTCASKKLYDPIQERQREDLAYFTKVLEQFRPTLEEKDLLMSIKIASSLLTLIQ